MNLRSVFSSRSDAECLDEEHAGDGGWEERDELHGDRWSNPRSARETPMTPSTYDRASAFAVGVGTRDVARRREIAPTLTGPLEG